MENYRGHNLTMDQQIKKGKPVKGQEIIIAFNHSSIEISYGSTVDLVFCTLYF